MIAGDFNYDPEKDAQCSDPPGWLDGGREAGPTFGEFSTIEYCGF